ncbi:MAG: hypothetical protein ABSD70_11520 [Terracidiphilus sp.]|jgi:hypothetical protein
MRKLLSLAFLTIPALACLTAQAQSPTDGRTEGGAYVNSYFHLTYRWPGILQPTDMRALQLGPGSPYGNEFLLFAARQGDAPDGIVILAERLNYPTPHSRGIRDSADFLDRLMRFHPEEHVVILSKKHFAGASGLVFDEFDYTQDGAFNAGVVTTVGQFLIVFKCNAATATDLEQMTKSAAAMEIHR